MLLNFFKKKPIKSKRNTGLKRLVDGVVKDARYDRVIEPNSIEFRRKMREARKNND